MESKSLKKMTSDLCRYLFVAIATLGMGICCAPAQHEKTPSFDLLQTDEKKVADVEKRAKEYILELVPLGTDIDTALNTLKEKTGLKVRHSPGNGIILPSNVAKVRGIEGPVGVQSITVTLKRQEHGKMPAVTFLFAMLGFDKEGKLIQVETLIEIDAV